MDTTGDLRIDLFGSTPADPEGFKVWRNVWNASAPGEVFALCVSPASLPSALLVCTSD